MTAVHLSPGSQVVNCDGANAVPSNWFLQWRDRRCEKAPPGRRGQVKVEQSTGLLGPVNCDGANAAGGRGEGLPPWQTIHGRGIPTPTAGMRPTRMATGGSFMLQPTGVAGETSWVLVVAGVCVACSRDPAVLMQKAE